MNSKETGYFLLGGLAIAIVAFFLLDKLGVLGIAVAFGLGVLAQRHWFHL